jgi:hypothetical protein
MVAARLANMRQGERTDKQPSANLQKVARADAATMLNVSTRSVSSARAVLDHGTDELKHAVDSGHLAVSVAAKALHPVVIRPDGTLIAGERRIEAFKALARTEISVTVVDIAKIVAGEFAENTERKDFTWTEAVEIKRAVAPLEEAAAEERMKAGKGPDGSGGRGKKKNPSANGTKVKQGPRAADKVAKATGKKAKTLAKAEAVVAAAERYGPLSCRTIGTTTVAACFASKCTARCIAPR